MKYDLFFRYFDRSGDTLFRKLNINIFDFQGSYTERRLFPGFKHQYSVGSRIATGDQAIFVRREAFAAVGGFAAVALFEDVRLSAALKRRGRIACLRARVVTSGRRWERRGALRTILLMWSLRLGHALGVSPARLRRLYPDVR